MNKQELIAKCKEIQPEFDILVCTKFIEISFGEYFQATVWENGKDISIETCNETQFVPVNFPLIILEAQQYFKEQENE